MTDIKLSEENRDKIFTWIKSFGTLSTFVLYNGELYSKIIDDREFRELIIEAFDINSL